MTDIAIRVENLSKLYRIGKAQRRHDTLRDAIVDAFKRFNVKTFKRSNVPTGDDTIWALKDVSFEVPRGEVLGIIGRNGAGKSTLLKILSRITEPTSGRAIVNGRVGSLLEVGTGFHPELTGRENIYLNGAILGMKKAEIQRKFDEIVAFAEIEQFLDTPVKHYSSGMYVRLAFAVAAHLEPEILLVDEVLAVGDAQFQKKCLGKMGDVAKEGRTVLFVSHNMAAVQRLCRQAILLDQGILSAIGGVVEVMNTYLHRGESYSLHWTRSSPPKKDAYIESVSLRDSNGNPIDYVTTATRLAVVVQFVVRRPFRNLRLTVGLVGPRDEDIFDTFPEDGGLAMPTDVGKYRATVHLPAGILMAQPYGIKAGLWLPQEGVLDHMGKPCFWVYEASSPGNSASGGRIGLLTLPCRWSLEQIDGTVDDV